MPVRRFFHVLTALYALLMVVGCTDSQSPMLPETDEPIYVQGVQLNKQGRNGEALTSFLKVIEKRGERGAAESHLEAGVIYLNHIKDPVLAYYHFKRYLELQANSKEAPRVRGMLDAALRDIARRFPGRPTADQSVRLAAAEEINKLRRENDELRAELQMKRGGGASVASRRTGVIMLPEELQSPAAAGPRSVGAGDPSMGRVPEPVRAIETAPARPVQTIDRPATFGGRVHTVRPKDSLWRIAREYYGGGATAAQVRAIFEANRNVMKHESDLKAGMTLRVP